MCSHSRYLVTDGYCDSAIIALSKCHNTLSYRTKPPGRPCGPRATSLTALTQRINYPTELLFEGWMGGKLTEKIMCRYKLKELFALSKANLILVKLEGDFIRIISGLYFYIPEN
jgi:hypothetical protein